MKPIAVVFTLMALILSLSFVSPVDATEIKKWVDENGKVHYGEKALAGDSSTVVNGSISVVKGAQTGKTATLYSTKWCGFCKKARAFLDANGIRYREVDIERSAVDNQRYKQLGGNGVPFLVRGDEKIQGFSKERYTAFFDLL